MLEIVQRALCLIGNASKFISQARRSKLLEAIEPSWSKYATDSHVANDTLFGKDIQASLTSTIEADSALFKAVSIVKWSQKGKEPLGSSIRIDGQASTCLLRGGSCQVWGPPARYRARKARLLHLYTSQYRYYMKKNQNPRFYKPRLPQMDASPHTSKRFPGTLPPNTLHTTGISMDLTIARREADTPVGGRLQLFSEN